MAESGNPAGTFTVDVTIPRHFHPERTRTVREVMDRPGAEAGDGSVRVS